MNCAICTNKYIWSARISEEICLLSSATAHVRVYFNARAYIKENLLSNKHLSQNPSNKPINIASVIRYDKCMFFTWKAHQHNQMK